MSKAVRRLDQAYLPSGDGFTNRRGTLAQVSVPSPTVVERGRRAPREAQERDPRATTNCSEP